MGNVVEVGCCRYFMESRASGQSAGLGRLFWCFERGKYLNVVKVMFLKNLFIFLWTLVLIIPGIIKTYEYAMVPYILSENPNICLLYTSGIKVERTRIIAIVMSTVCAGIGMVLYLQNMGNISTYASHKQIGMFCIAALLVGGASVDKASIGNVFVGAVLFHLKMCIRDSLQTAQAKSG